MIIKLSSDKVINQEGNIILSDATGVVGDITYIRDPENDGEYLQQINVDGYTDQIGREDYAYFILGKKLGVEKDVNIEFEDYSPLTSTSWVAKTIGDGVYKFWMVYVKYTYNLSGDTFNHGELVYNIPDGKIYRVGTWGGPIEVESLIGEDSTEPVEFPLIVKAGRLYTELVAKRVKMLMKCCSDKEVAIVGKAVDDVEAGVYSFTYEYCKGNKINAIKIADYLNNKDYSHVLGL